MIIAVAARCREGLERQRAGADSLSQTQGPAWHIPPRNWTTDYDDTIFQAELLASRALIQGLGERGNRIGVISYCARARRRAAIGAPQDALAATARIRATTDALPTDLAAAFNAARRELLRLDPGPWPRQRAVILFTDGRPTDPRDEDVARVQAIYEAEALAKRGIALYVIRFGPLGIPDGRFLLALAGAAGGRNFPVGDPHRLLNELPPGVQTCHSGSSASDVIPCSARATDAHDRPLRNFAAFRVQGQVAPTGRWGWAFRTVPEFVHSGLRSRNEYLS